jgi:glycosyltransferase involved in cell wall biosynthesis
MKPIKILHIVSSISGGGGCRALVAAAKYSSKLGTLEHSILALKEADKIGLELAHSANIPVVVAPEEEELSTTIAQADIVQVNFWNNPIIYEFLRSNLPPMRLVLWFHVSGDKPPQMITDKLVDLADMAVAGSPYTYEHPVLQNLPAGLRWQKTAVVNAGADFERLTGCQGKPHKGFNVGYIGNLRFVKAHPNYVPMSVRVSVPDVKFIVCGSGKNDIQEQAQELGVTEKFEFRGYVEDIKSAIEIFDVYGYPISEHFTAGAELNLQEVMYAGVPPVVFPYCGIKRVVEDNYTGLIVHSELEYTQAIEYLYHHPEERTRLGNHAREYAQKLFGAENTAKQFNPIYEKLMQQPKRKREWGMREEINLLTAPVSLEDLTQKPLIPTGAELFIESLGNGAPQFSISMSANNILHILTAESKIAASPHVLQQSAAGIFTYRDYYPDDPNLHLWSGLILQKQEQHDRAIKEFKIAIKQGLTHWRLQWYIAKSAEKKGDIATAKEVLNRVLQESRNFEPAREMLASISDEPLPQKKAKSTAFTQTKAIATLPARPKTNNLLKLAHIVNPVVVDEASDLLVAQPITLATMKTAQAQAKDIADVQLYSAQYPEDRAFVPEGFIKTPDLHRSVLDFGEFKVPRKLPILTDILDRLYDAATEADYLIYTNVDIGLMPYFYITVSKIIEQGYDAFTINRRVITEHYTKTEYLPLMYAEIGENHQGHDCFVIKRSLYSKFVLGHVCLGIPYVGLSLLVNCICQANKFIIFKHQHLTFHIGADRIWKDTIFDDYRQHNGNELQQVLQHYRNNDKLEHYAHHLVNFKKRYVNLEKLSTFSHSLLEQIQADLDSSKSRLSQIKADLERTQSRQA